nr:hypothetical protein [Salinicoccus hispanicus]
MTMMKEMTVIVLFSIWTLIKLKATNKFMLSGGVTKPMTKTKMIMMSK